MVEGSGNVTFSAEIRPILRIGLAQWEKLFKGLGFMSEEILRTVEPCVPWWSPSEDLVGDSSIQDHARAMRWKVRIMCQGVEKDDK